MTEGTPTLDLHGSLATLTLRRPTLRNSLNDDDLNTLLAHFETLNNNTHVQVVVLRAYTQGQINPIFSAGYHVGGFDNDAMHPCFLKKSLKPLNGCAPSPSVP